ncbi:uncharacterized protein LOC125651806 [Ostrea edulis]|uniref:uncharacterized protein LOC125651806 n=1 Tax=Ostrea edulis TaxID=37623 RepID=UPI0020965296|nr:uncharacterized protein LOC125651806 [Ostrea edulis]
MSTKRRFNCDDIGGSVKKRQCMHILNEQQILRLLAQKESQLIERMEVVDENFASQGESRGTRTDDKRLTFPINSFPLQGLNNHQSQQHCERCLAGEPGHYRHVNS